MANKIKSKIDYKKYELLIPITLIMMYFVYDKARNRPEGVSNARYEFTSAFSPIEPKKAEFNPREEYPSYLQIGGDYTYVRWKPSGSSSLHGSLGGAQGSYEFKPLNNVYAAAKLNWKQGNTHGSGSSRFLLYIDAQERLGYTFAFEDKKWLLTLFSGVGYRHLGHHLRSSGARYKYNEFYVPVGLTTDVDVNSWFTWGLGFTWMAQVFPTVSISTIAKSNWTLQKTFDNFFVEMPFDFIVTKNKRFHITLKPFYEKWHDGHTTAITSTGGSLELPSNKYNFWGGDVNLGYRF